MRICTKCKALCEQVCPVCGLDKYLAEPQQDQPVLLIILNPVQAMFVEPILKDSGIPYYCPGALGRAFTLKAGMTFESYRFYVPYAAVEQCRKLIEDVFGEDEAIMQALHELKSK